MSRDESDFVQAILAHPDDPTFRQVYADWLEDHGDPRAEFLRLEQELARLLKRKKRYRHLRQRIDELRRQLDPDWLAAMSQSRIERCPLRFAFECPKRWDRLKLTAVARVRYCGACQKHVHFCQTLDEAADHAKQGHCVAIDAGVPRRDGDLQRRTLDREPRVRMGRIRVTDWRRRLHELRRQRERQRDVLH